MIPCNHDMDQHPNGILFVQYLLILNRKELEKKIVSNIDICGNERIVQHCTAFLSTTLVSNIPNQKDAIKEVYMEEAAEQVETIYRYHCDHYGNQEKKNGTENKMDQEEMVRNTIPWIFIIFLNINENQKDHMDNENHLEDIKKFKQALNEHWEQFKNHIID